MANQGGQTGQRTIFVQVLVNTAGWDVHTFRLYLVGFLERAIRPWEINSAVKTPTPDDVRLTLKRHYKVVYLPGHIHCRFFFLLFFFLLYFVLLSLPSSSSRAVESVLVVSYHTIVVIPTCPVISYRPTLISLYIISDNVRE